MHVVLCAYHPAGAAAVISCIGGFGTEEQMRRINGTANVTLIAAAKAAGVPRFTLVSAHLPQLPGFDVLMKASILLGIFPSA